MRSKEHWADCRHQKQHGPLPKPDSTSAAASGSMSSKRPKFSASSVLAPPGKSSAARPKYLPDKSGSDPGLRLMMHAADDMKKIARDPFHLARFEPKHLPKNAPTFETALREIRDGKKRSHWSWFYILTSPWVQIGIEIGSRINKDYALRDCPGGFDGFEAARAFLDNPDLRGKLCEMFKAIQDQLFAKMEAGTPQANVAGALLGTDAHKLLSSVRLFYTVTLARAGQGRASDDEDVHVLCTGIMNAMNISEHSRMLESNYKSTDDDEVVFTKVTRVDDPVASFDLTGDDEGHVSLMP
jgi:uncharacterized protein (DUF1810 family)